MISGTALIIISQCMDGHPNGARAVLVLGIIMCVLSFIKSIVAAYKKANE